MRATIRAVRDTFLIRQLVNVGWAANALAPLPGAPASIPAFFAGWLGGELAPHALTATLADTAQYVARNGTSDRNTRIALLAAGVSVAGYAALISAGRRSAHEIEDGLVEALGPDYRRGLSFRPDEPVPSYSWRSVANPFAMRDSAVKVVRRVPYAVGGERFEADIYHHRDVPPGAPVLVQVHGGGWVIGKKEQQGIPLMTRMAARGWVCVAVNYPLSPRARWPEHLIALKRAIAWVRGNIAEYGGDPSFLAVTGGSAGGHLSSMLALTGNDPALQPGFEDVDTSVQACAPQYGVYDFTGEDGTKASRQRLNNLIRPMVMPRDAQYPDDYRAASPISRVSADAPPFFVVHGRNDSLVPAADARAFVAELRKVSKQPVGYVELAHAQHAYDIFLSIRCINVVTGIERFLDWAYTDWLNSDSVARQA
jgi:acetyl esterase/lipase